MVSFFNIKLFLVKIMVVGSNNLHRKYQEEKDERQRNTFTRIRWSNNFKQKLPPINESNRHVLHVLR
jgi:hypothetical protein